MSYQDRDSSARHTKKHATIFNTYDYAGDASVSHSKECSKERSYAMRASRDSRESDYLQAARPILKPKKASDLPQTSIPKRSADRRPSLANSRVLQEKTDTQPKLTAQTKVFQVNVISRRQPSKVCCPNCYNIFAVRDSYPLHEKQGNELSFRPLDSPKNQHWNRFNIPSSSRDELRVAHHTKHPAKPKVRQESKENLTRNEYINQTPFNYS